MNFYSLASLLASSVCIALGIFVFLKDRRNRLNQSFTAIIVLTGLWTFFPFVTAQVSDTHLANLLARIIYVFAAFVPAAWYFFVSTLLGSHDRPHERRLLRLLLGASSLLAVLATTPYLFTEVIRNQPFSAVVPGPLYLVFILYFASGCGHGWYKCYTGYLQSAGLKRNQLKYILVSFGFAYIAGALHFIAAYFRAEPFPHDFLLIVFAAVISYAIARHRLMDINVFIHKGLAYALVLAGILVPVYVAVVVTERATAFSIPPLLAGTLVFASGLWIFLKNPRAVTNATFGLLCVSASLWLFSFFVIYTTKSPEKVLLWGKLLHLGIVYVPALFYHFSVSLLNRPRPRYAVIAWYAVSTAFVPLVPTDSLISGHYRYAWGFYPQAGSLHPLFVAYFLVIGAFCLRMLYRGYTSMESTQSDEAKRIKFVFWAFLLGYASAIDFLQAYGVAFYPVGFLFVSLWVMLVSYAIAKYQLLDISVIFSRARLLPYLQGLGILLTFYALTLVVIRLFTGTTFYLLAAILLASFVLCAELLVNVQRRMERAVGKAFFRERHDAYETLSAFSKDLVTILDLKNLNERFLGVLSRVLNIPTVSLYLLDKEKQAYHLVSSRGVDAERLLAAPLPAHDPLPRHLSATKAPVVREELQHHATEPADRRLIGILDAMYSEACIPLINKERLVGFCNLGPRAKHEMYSPEDLSLLTTLAQNAAIALDNALLYEDVKKSQLLMRRTDRLRSLETIAGGFAHEIRNPLTSIKTFIQLAPERKDDADFLNDFSKVVNDDVTRIERLIEEILDYARYMKPKLTLEDLNDIVSSCLYFIQVKADSMGASVERDLAPGLPYVMLDRQQIKQVLLNLLLNALDAMKDEGGRLIIRTHRLVKRQGEEWVQVEVTDTGPGIEPGNLEHIFDPFYTTKHESGEREGTGLGLAIVHQIVQEHRGTIEVDSAVGRGTTFYVNLPATSEVTRDSTEQEEHEEAGPVGR